jgi:flagellar protein FlgJ
MSSALRWGLAVCATVLGVVAPVAAQAATSATVPASDGGVSVRSGPLSPLGTVQAIQPLDHDCHLGPDSADGNAIWDGPAGGALLVDAYPGWPGRPALAWCPLDAGPAPTDHDAFIAWAAAIARPLRATYQVPVSVTVAQAILESGWGTSALSVDGNSFFGMKCFDTLGAATGCRAYSTTECDASCYPTTASFRVYQFAAASFADHANQLATLARYRPAFAYAHDPDRFAVAIQRAGYATDPSYAQILIGLMRQFDLYRYDA